MEYWSAEVMKPFREKTLKRMVKTKREISLIKKAVTIADSCIPVIEAALKEDNITEKEIARRIRAQMKSKGAREAFKTIVASDKRSAEIHANPRASDNIVKGMGLIDFGANYRGYRSDITVPFIKGKISKRKLRIVKTVMRAYNVGIKALKVGVPCWKVHYKVENFLNKRGYDFPHPVGHGIGLKTHELPYMGNLTEKKMKILAKKYDKIKMARVRRKWEYLKTVRVEPGMVFTIEPGVYIEGVGGSRFENTVLMTARGAKVLTHSRLIKI